MAIPRGFLSYAHEDSEAAERLFVDLEQMGFALWFDRRHFRPEEDVDAQVLNAIKESYFFVIVLSPTSVSKNGYVRKEVRLALEMLSGLGPSHTFIIPVRIAECEPRPDEIAGLSHYIDLFPDWRDGLRQLAALLPTNEEAPNIQGASPHEVQTRLSDVTYLRNAAIGFKHRSAIAVFVDNCLRQVRGLEPQLVSRKIINIQRNTDDFVACIELHYVERCGSGDNASRCGACGANGTIVHGTIDIGGYSQSDYNDNYVAWCTNCYWAWHHFEIDYHGTGPLKFDYATNTYG
jgi:hypothetical protein